MMVNWPCFSSHAMIERYRGSDRMSRMNSKILVGFETLPLSKAAKVNKNIMIGELLTD